MKPILLILSIFIFLVSCQEPKLSFVEFSENELVQLELAIDSLSKVNELNGSYFVCDRYSYFSFDDSQIKDSFDIKKNSVITNKKYFGHRSRKLGKIGNSKSSKNYFSVSGINNGYIKIFLVENLSHEIGFDCENEVNNYKFYLVKINKNSFEIINGDEVHYG